MKSLFGLLIGCGLVVAVDVCGRDRGEAPVTPQSQNGGERASWLQPALGLQLWSLRAEIRQDVRAALDLVPKYGLGKVELAGTGGLSPAAFRRLLDERGLVPVAAHYGPQRFRGDLQGLIDEAKVLGVEYVICPAMPHISREWDAAEVRRYAEELNGWGRRLRAANLLLGVHTHGQEFAPARVGSRETLFDLLMRETNPEFVCVEIDVFWAVHAGVDPVELLARHDGRWRLLHVKDIRLGAATGMFTGVALSADNVPVGAGQVNWQRVLPAAHAAGVIHYFIEDETTAPLSSIPSSVRYLRNLEL